MVSLPILESILNSIRTRISALRQRVRPTVVTPAAVLPVAVLPEYRYLEVFPKRLWINDVLGITISYHMTLYSYGYLLGAWSAEYPTKAALRTAIEARQLEMPTDVYNWFIQMIDTVVP